MKMATPPTAPYGRATGPYRTSASIESSADDAAFLAEVRAGARHAVLTRRRAYLNRLLGRGGRPSLWVMSGIAGGLAILLLLGALVLFRASEWLIAFEMLITSVVLPHLLRAALAFAARRIDVALARARTQMDAVVLAWAERTSALRGYGEHNAIASSTRAAGDASGAGFVDALLDDREVVEHAFHELDAHEGLHDDDAGAAHDHDFFD
jgi:hypothetical protein